MYIARVLYPVEVLGPGKRIAIWTCGCLRKCVGCANPELWDFDETRNIKIEYLIDMVNKIAADNIVEGFTITGGEPFCQIGELKILIDALSKISKDILVFSGFYIEELNVADLDNIAVLVDGPYLKERNMGLLLRGSDNQRIHILNKDYDIKYQKYLQDKRSKIQNFLDGTSVISVGIHKSDYSEKLEQMMTNKGLIIREDD